MLSLSGHIGAKVSALVDGQLPSGEEERAWSHVLACPGCRRLVEHEGWTKRQLGGLSGARGAAPADLMGSLYAVEAWAQVDEIERRSTRRRATAVVVGGGAVSAAVIGILAVTGAPIGRDLPTRQAPADISSPSQSSTARPSPVPSPSPGSVRSSQAPALPGRSR